MVRGPSGLIPKSHAFAGLFVYLESAEEAADGPNVRGRRRRWTKPILSGESASKGLVEVLPPERRDESRRWATPWERFKDLVRELPVDEGEEACGWTRG